MTPEPAKERVWPERAEVEDLLGELTAIRSDLVDEASLTQPVFETVHPNYRDSARNLLHYLALRRRDLRPLQRRLAALGLSSLGRAESHVLATVDSVVDIMHRLTGTPGPKTLKEAEPVDFAKGQQLLVDHTDRLLGTPTPGRNVRIMVTMPSEAADDYTLVHNLLQSGMECMRINCAHDGPDAWQRMIGHLRRAEAATARSCKVVMDLAGPKLRTGPLEPGPAVVRIHPARDMFGRVQNAARVWLTAEEEPIPPPSAADALLPVPFGWLAGLRPADRISLTDARNAQRGMTVVDVTEDGAWAEAVETAFIIPGTVLRRERRGDRAVKRDASVGTLPSSENSLTLQEGDQLIVTRNQKPGRSATVDSSGRILTPAMIGCTIPEVFEDVCAGEPVWFDDGKIGGTIEKIESGFVLVRITRAKPGGGKLRSDKGINLPESELSLNALTPKDIEDLEFVVRHADVVEMSFANRPRDVEDLLAHLSRMAERQLALVLKIETQRAFKNLPDMLLTAMRTHSFGVMIARGDLAVECGFQRMAEVQEEILWICEAAHVPVIWATQVLETLAKKGMPSRAEISDAAMGHRAECVMLNKGPHVVTAVRALDDILRRMQAHQDKKQSMLRELHLAHRGRT